MLDVLYAVQTSSVICTVKTSLDLFSLGRKQIWIYVSVMGDQIYEMRCLFVPVGLLLLYSITALFDNSLTRGHPSLVLSGQVSHSLI